VALDEVMMETQYNNAFYDEPIQVIVTTQALFEKYNDLARTSIQTNKPDARIAEMGFDNATFKGKPIIWDRDCTARPHVLPELQVSDASGAPDVRFRG
jgi:hypothetical protein